MTDDNLGEILISTFCVYFVGLIVGMLIMRSRAGFGSFAPLVAYDGNGTSVLGWLITCLAMITVWPVSLVIWLARGCPPPRIVFNEKAAERRRSAAGS